MNSENATSVSDSTAKRTEAKIGRHAPTWTKRLSGRWEWRIREQWVPFFDTPDAPNWLKLNEDARATCVKTNTGRDVWRIEVGGHLLFVKISRPPRRWAKTRRWLKGSNAERERRVADYASQHAISTVTPIASAQTPIIRDEPDSILITIGLPKANDLIAMHNQLDPHSPETRKLKNRVIDTVAHLIASAHQNGFVHTDLHAGNILVEPQPDGTFRASFVDLQNIRIGQSLSQARVVRNLAQLNQWFRIRGHLTDRIRFLDRYIFWRQAVSNQSTQTQPLTQDRRALIRMLDRAAKEHADTLYAKRDRKARRDGRYYARVKLNDGWRAIVYLASKHPISGSRATALLFTRGQWQRWLQRPLDWINTGDKRMLLKNSATGTISRARLVIPDGEPLEVVCKRPSAKRWHKRLLNMVRTSRAMLAWRKGNALLHRGIPTARPLAVLEQRCFGLVVDSFIITEYIANACDLDTVLTVKMRELTPRNRYRLKQQITESLAAVVQRLYDHGFTHRDFKAPNIIVQWAPETNDPPRVILVDLDGVKRLRTRRPNACHRALVRLNISLDHCRSVNRSDRLRFLKRCFDRPGSGLKDWKPLWREMAIQSERKRQVRQQHQEEMLKQYGRF